MDKGDDILRFVRHFAIQDTITFLYKFVFSDFLDGFLKLFLRALVLFHII